MFLIRATGYFFVDTLRHIKCGVGRMLREGGLELDKFGSWKARDVAYQEPLNRHRNIHDLLSSSTYVAPNATIIGSVYAASNTYFSFGCTIKADNYPVRIGKNTSVGENSVLECSDAVPDEAVPNSLNIGNGVRIEHGCHLRSCIVDDNVHIGFRSVIQEGAQLERGCVIAPNSVVPPGSLIPENTMWAGSPVQFVRNLTEEEINLQKGQLDKERIQLQLEQP